MKVFAYIMKQTGFSSIYVKYTFTDAMKQISEYTDSNVDMVPCIQKIYQARTLEEVNILSKYRESMSFSFFRK